VHLRVAADSSAHSLLRATLEEAEKGASVMTDEWSACRQLETHGRSHAIFNHREREWARDDDGDGIREVHTNSIEGLWTPLRNWLRSFRGVSKMYLQGYISAFEWVWNRKSLNRANLSPSLHTGFKGASLMSRVEPVSMQCFCLP
jgi:transposase-like protein